MMRINGKLVALCASALVLYSCEKEDDLLESSSTSNHEMEENCDVIDFESIATGTYVSSISTSLGTVGVVGYAVGANDILQTDRNRARIFDSEHWTGDDDDLATEDWGHVLIVQDVEEDESVPNDNKYGAQIELTFPEPVTLESMRVIDIDNGGPREDGSPHPIENASYVYLYVEGSDTPVEIYLEPHGDNVGFDVNLLGTENVVRMVVVFDGTAGAVGSGAIDDIRFCVEEHGCTRTQGYWKTHSGISKGKGNTKYDATWDDFLNATISGLGTYREVLWMEPKGDARIILAHQFIAAELNIAAGASISGDAWVAWMAAKTYFNGGDTDATRAELIAWAEILANYNEGEIGPGHCDE